MLMRCLRMIRNGRLRARRSARCAMDVSRELGYSDPYFFYRQFKRKTGMTPVEFRGSFIARKP